MTKFVIGKSYKHIITSLGEVSDLTVGKYYELIRQTSGGFFSTINDRKNEVAYYSDRFDSNDCLEDKETKSMNIVDQSKGKLSVDFKADESKTDYIIPGLFKDKNGTVIMIISLDDKNNFGKGFVVKTSSYYSVGLWSSSWDIAQFEPTYGEVTLKFTR